MTSVPRILRFTDFEDLIINALACNFCSPAAECRDDLRLHKPITTDYNGSYSHEIWFSVYVRRTMTSWLIASYSKNGLTLRSSYHALSMISSQKVIPSPN